MPLREMFTNLFLINSTIFKTNSTHPLNFFVDYTSINDFHKISDVHGLCEPNEFKCANKRCILKTWLCDSEDDCKDGWDEQECDEGPVGAACRPHEYQCRSGRQCVPRSFHCDGEKDCLDGSDEVGCCKWWFSNKVAHKNISTHSGTVQWGEIFSMLENIFLLKY